LKLAAQQLPPQVSQAETPSFSSGHPSLQEGKYNMHRVKVNVLQQAEKQKS